jgi:hypothetical protein
VSELGQSKKQPIFLLPVNTPAHLPNQSRIANALQSKGFETYLLFQFGNARELLKNEQAPRGVEKLLPRPANTSQLDRNTKNWIDKLDPIRKGRRPLSMIRVLVTRPKWIAMSMSNDRATQSAQGSQQESLESREHTSRTIFKSLRSKNVAVIYPEINYFYQHIPFFGLMKSLKAKQFIVPFSLVNELEGLTALSTQANRVKLSIQNKIVDWIYPSWVRSFQNRKVRMPLKHVISSSIHRYATYNPWLPGANLEVPILTPDRFTLEYLKAAGYDSRQLLQAGSIFGKTLLSNRKQRTRELAQGPSRIKVLVAIPPNEIGYSISEYVSKIVEPIIRPILTTSKAELTACLHPRTSQLERLEIQALGLKITGEDTETAISKSDVYVACSSATLRVSESLGIPSVNYDIYNFGYDDFVSAKNIVTVNLQEAYENCLAKVLVSRQVGELDGQLGLDLVQNILNLSKS